MEGEVDNVKVVVRCRPLSSQEIQQGHTSVVKVDKIEKSIAVGNPASKTDPPKVFTFDEVFDQTSDQITIYNTVARPIVENVLKGYNGTVFAYGQTGTGKTYTMSGGEDAPEQRGIIPNSFAHIFDHIAKCQQDKTFLVRVSYLEIYNEEIRDLLAKTHKTGLEIKERPDVGVYVKDLSSVTVSSADHMYKIMQFGNEHRAFGATNMNEFSSRSHTVFTITLECSEGTGPRQHLTQGKLHLVDLAGSERQAKTGATGDRLKEASKINLSLSTLGNVISSLVDAKSTHIPYRNSKLTRLLQDSLGGNSKTVMVANVGPASYNYDETISTLRYANRAKNIRNVVRINEDPKDALLRKYQEEIETLRKQLEGEEFSGGESDVDDNRSDDGGNVEQQRRVAAANAHFDERVAAMEKEIHAKQLRLEQEKGMAESERRTLAEELMKKEAELRHSKDEHERLMSKLASIEKKLIIGGENMLEKAEKQAKLLDESNKELEKARDHEMELRQRLATRQAERLDMEEKYNTLQEEAQAKTRKLKKVWTAYMQAKGEMEDMQGEHQREMEGLLDNVRQLQKELSYFSAVIDNYVPEEYQRTIEQNVFWSEEMGEWQLKCIAYTGNNMRIKTVPPTVYKQQDPQLKPLYVSYSDFVDSPVQPMPSSSAPPRQNFRPKSAKKDRNAARIKALLD